MFTEKYKPTLPRIRAVHPPMPRTVIISLDFFLKRFLIVTLLVNESRFQINLIRSRRTRLPGLGAFGRINNAGLTLSSLYEATAEAIIVVAREITVPIIR